MTHAPMQTIISTEEDYDYGLDSSLVSALIKLEGGRGRVIMDLVDAHFHELPKKSGHVQLVAGVIHDPKAFYFQLAYINEPDSYASFMSVDLISTDEYLDHRIANQVFTQNF